MLAININAIIKVKLTDYGVSTLKTHHLEAVRNRWFHYSDYLTLIKPREDGFHYFQLHQFISIFGEKISKGCLPAIESCLIYIDERDLEKVDDA